MRAHGPEGASAPPTIDQIETLNRLGESLSATLVTKLLVEEDLRGTLSLGPANPASEMRPGLKAELRFP